MMARLAPCYGEHAAVGGALPCICRRYCRCVPAALSRRAGALSSTREPWGWRAEIGADRAPPWPKPPDGVANAGLINYTSLYDFLTAPLAIGDRRESTAGAGTKPAIDTDRPANPALSAQIRPDRSAGSPVAFCIHSMNARLYSEGEYNQ